MKFSQTCINRPVFTSVIAFILILIGTISFYELPVRFSPFYFNPTLMVITDIGGASAEYVEQNITTPLEQSLSGIPGLDTMESKSRKGQSFIMLKFKGMTTEDFITAQSQVLQYVDSTTLPDQADSPFIVQRGDDNMVMLLGISDDQMPHTELINYVNNYLEPRLSQVKGVGQIQVYADDPVLRITLDPRKMASFNINTGDIQDIIKSSNTSFPLGSLLTDEQALQLNSEMNVPDIPSFENLVLAKKGSRLVYLKDIAKVVFGYSSLNHFYAYSNGKPGIAIEVDATNQANPIAVGQGIKKLIAHMSPTLPHSMSINPVFDLSTPLQNAVNDVYVTIFIAIILVIFITLLFLGNWRATLIPIVTIPVCLIAAFSIMFALGFSINVMTLLALVLAVGLVVDDAIVVLENTFRHIEAGKSPLAAAKQSINEISFAVLGITVCLIAVYIPAAFLPHNLDTTYFQEFAFSLAGAILISGFLALTLSPMMCSRLLRKHSNSGYEQKLDRSMQKITRYYNYALNWVLRHPKTIFSILLINLVLGLGLFYILPTDLLPKSPLSQIQGFLNGPNSANNEYLNQKSTPFRLQLEHDPKLEHVLLYVNGSGNIFFMAKVKPGNNPNAIVTQLNQEIKDMPEFSGGAMVVDANDNHGSNHQGSLYFYISGLADYEEIVKQGDHLRQALEKMPQFTTAYSATQFSDQEYNLMINRNLVTMLNIDLATLNSTLSTFLGGYTFPNTVYQVKGYGYSIVMQLAKSDLRDLSILDKLYVTNASGKLIPTSQLISVKKQADLPDRVHINQLRAGEIDVTGASNYSNGELISAIEAQARSTLPQNLQISWGGVARKLLENSASGNLFILLGLVFIYLVLAALFESFLDPLIILCTVPLCVVAGLIGLYLIDGSINIYTKIALVTLIGLVSKHGVLITQFANQLRAEGMPAVEAVKQAAQIRLRPILMTSLTMILGAMPLVFGLGTDGVGRQQIGVIIVLGLLLGSIFSLFIVPVAYLIIGRFKKKYRY